MFMRAFALLACATAWVAAHPHCWTGERSVDVDDDLDYCSTNDDASHGVCCTDAEEEALSLSVEAVVASLTDDCATYYKQVECALCGSYSGHLHERLDGLLTMGVSFCESYTTACTGQIEFETDFCDTRTGGRNEDFYWSYPYTDSATAFGEGFTEVFPDLPEDEQTGYNMILHQTPDGGKYWLGGKDGKIKQVDATDMTTSTTVMDLSGDVLGAVFYDSSIEEGLLDFAFSPMFDTNNYFYASYDINDTVVRNRLSKFVYTEGDAYVTKASEEVLMESDERPEYLHNGGWVAFKPSVYGTNVSYHDLYWSIGDGGPQMDPYDHGQRTDTLFGTMVRISVPSNGSGYVVPSGNYEGAELPEICAIGFRGHWRCSFDTANDVLYCGDVGYIKVESIDIVECGNNYGWKRFEGNRCTPYSEEEYGDCLDADRTFAVPPIFEYCHSSYYSDAEGEDEYTSGIDVCGDRSVLGSSVIGGHVYRGETYADLLYGAYVFAEYQLGNIYFIKQEEDGTWTPGSIISDDSIRVLTFTETVKGELIVIDNLNKIYHLPCGDLCVEGGRRNL